MFGRKTRLYADAAAATPMSREVKARLLDLLDIYGNPGAIHEEGVSASKTLESIRREAADAIGAHADEIVFTASGTEANNLALFGTLEKDFHVITSAIEHPSVLEPLRALERRGVRVSYLGVSEDGLLEEDKIQEAITGTTKLVSIGLINSEIGVLQNYKAFARIIRKTNKENPQNKILFHIDASQAPLWLDLKVEALGCDLLTLDAQKIMGPKGVGLLYVKRGVKLNPQTLGGGQERGLRSGTENIPLAGAFARALSLAQKDCVRNAERISEIRDTLWSEIKKAISEAQVNGSMERRAPNNLNISIPGLIGERAVLALSAYGVSASTRSACATKDENLSHVILALGVGADRAREAIRFTFLPDASARDISKIVDGLLKAAAKYKNIDSTI